MNCFYRKDLLGDEYCPDKGDVVAYYTQIVLNGKCTIPEQKPDSEKLVGVFHNINIKKAQAVDSVEFIRGHKFEGKKVIVAGILELGIEYSTNTPDQKVHFFECQLPFNAIILDCDTEARLLPCDFELKDYLVHVCVEHIQVERICERSFEKTIVLMIWLQPKYPCRFGRR